MKPCRKPKKNHRRLAETPQSPPPPPLEATVHRYAHPIRTARPAARPAAEEQFASIREALGRQSAQLEEVLRLLKGDNSDTI